MFLGIRLRVLDAVEQIDPARDISIGRLGPHFQISPGSLLL